MNKLVIWDLFGGGQNSVYHTIKENKLENKFEIYTFDVTDPIHQNQFKIDLSQDNIVDLFKSYPKPDLILASPLCQSFSCVLNMKGGGTCFWKLNETKDLLIERSVEEFERLKIGFTKNLKADVQLFIKRLGERCINNTIKLIEYYQPKYWYIENPKHSLMWKYLQLNQKEFFNKHQCSLNNASYGKYGYLTTKPTIFCSNTKLILKDGKIDPPYTIQEIEGKKYYVLKDDPNTKLRVDLDSRMLGLASINKILKARNVKSGMGGMDFIYKLNSNQNKYKQKNKMVNEQVCEAGIASAIPHSLILDILNQFISKIESKQLDDNNQKQYNLKGEYTNEIKI